MSVTDELPEVVTRKVGPLPAWGWVAAIVGAYVVYRVFSGGSQGSTSTVVGGTPTSFGDGTDPSTGEDIFSGPNSLVTQLQTQIGGLSDVQAMLTQLTGLLNQRSTALGSKASAQERRNAWRDKLRTCKTAKCKSDANAKIAAYQKIIDDADKTLAALNTQIADLQKKISEAQSG